MRDETDLSGLKLTIDLKRGAEPDKLMQKLFRMSPLQDSISCNFNVLVEGMPRVMGVGEILDQWIAWRMVCIRRQTAFTIQQKKDKLHLLYGLREILLDIDRAIRIIRETEVDSLVIPRLMEGFGIDEIQADYVADIRLRNINKEYILKRIQEVEDLERDIADLEDLMEKPERIRKLIIKQLQEVKKKYAVPRKTTLIFEDELEEQYDPETEIPEYPVHVFLSREGYLKKITPQSLRMSGEQKFKEGDGLFQSWETNNHEELMLFTNHRHCYKVHLSDLEDSKASLLGDYLPARLEMEEGESILWACLSQGYVGHILFFFENGKVARVEASSYQTITRRKKLTSAYSDKSPLVTALRLLEETEVTIYSTEGRALIFSTSTLATKNTRSTQGVVMMTLKPKYKVQAAAFLQDCHFVKPARYRARSLPAAGALLKEEDREEQQLSLL
jgi:DNA gyrase subunit A